MATFGPNGPEKCSGLKTMRYDRATLQKEFGPSFRPIRDLLVEHRTPFGSMQQFLYCAFRFEPLKGNQ